MSDASYDAIIIGGGNKGLILAMYLARYGGIKVGVFERREEAGALMKELCPAFWLTAIRLRWRLPII